MNKRLETALYTTRSPNDQEAHEELPSITTHDRNTKETTTETLTDTHSHMHACVQTHKWPRWNSPAGTGKWSNHFGKLLAVLSKDKYMRHSDPEISPVGANPVDVSVYVHQHTCTGESVAALPVQLWKQPKRPATVERTNCSSIMHRSTMECWGKSYCKMEKNEQNLTA